jgi:hypothetical protein
MFYLTATYNIGPGGTFAYTGKTTTYTVPGGITQLNIRAIGGGTRAGVMIVSTELTSPGS